MICSVEGCERKGLARNLCSAHYQRERKGQEMTTPIQSQLRGSAEERFWAKIDFDGPGGCWLWTGTLWPNGYGMFSVGGRAGRLLLAHRFSYEYLVGPIPEGLTIDHVRARGCTHRNCVNPAHLEPVTQRVNVLRGTGLPAQQARQTHCKRDHEFNAENTLYRANRVRDCRICKRERDRQRYARKKESARG